MVVTGADEQLTKILRRPWDRRLLGVSPRDVEPSIHAGYVVLYKTCRCYLKTTIYLAGDDGASANAAHHHLVPVPEKLWRALSEERGWPQDRWRLSGD